MNIIVRTYGGKVVVRPDTTWERHNRDYFAPDYVTSLEWSPVIFIRISGAARSTAEKFASRYFDAWGRGVLLYASNLIDGTAEGYAASLCLNRSSYLPNPLSEAGTMSAEDRALAIKALSECSFRLQLRSGDLIAIETAGRKHLCDAPCSFREASGLVDGPDFNIIF